MITKTGIEMETKNGHKQLMLNLILFTILKDRLKIETRTRTAYVKLGGRYNYTNISLNINELNLLANFLKKNGGFELYANRYDDEMPGSYIIPGNEFNCFRIVTKEKYNKHKKTHFIHIKGDFEYIAFIHVDNMFLKRKKTTCCIYQG